MPDALWLTETPRGSRCPLPPTPSFPPRQDLAASGSLPLFRGPVSPTRRLPSPAPRGPARPPPCPAPRHLTPRQHVPGDGVRDGCEDPVQLSQRGPPVIQPAGDPRRHGVLSLVTTQRVLAPEEGRGEEMWGEGGRRNTAGRGGEAGPARDVETGALRPPSSPSSPPRLHKAAPWGPPMRGPDPAATHTSLVVSMADLLPPQGSPGICYRGARASFFLSAPSCAPEPRGSRPWKCTFDPRAGGESPSSEVSFPSVRPSHIWAPALGPGAGLAPRCLGPADTPRLKCARNGHLRR